MKRETSLYLDLGRVLAAAAVFIHNAKKLTDGFLAPFGQFGNEAVIVFFVISGIVIAHTVDTRKRDASQYAIARLTRLWSVAVPAVVLTILLDCIGSWLAPPVYRVFNLPLWREDLTSVWHGLAPILFLNQTWLNPVGPGSNGPFWSLGYEAPYYLAFGLYVFCSGWTRVFGLVLTAIIMGPSVTGLAAFWVLGVTVFRLLGRGRSSSFAWAGWAVSLTLMAAFYAAKYKLITAFSYVVFGTMHFSPEVEYVFPCTSVALLFAVNIVCFDRIAGRFAAVGNTLGPAIRFLAARSFSMYLYQAPLLFFFGACAAHVEPPPARIAIVYLGTIASVLALFELTGKRKRYLAALLSLVIGHHHGAPAVATPGRP